MNLFQGKIRTGSLTKDFCLILEGLFKEQNVGILINFSAFSRTWSISWYCLRKF